MKTVFTDYYINVYVNTSLLSVLYTNLYFRFVLFFSYPYPINSNDVRLGNVKNGTRYLIDSWTPLNEKIQKCHKIIKRVFLFFHFILHRINLKHYLNQIFEPPRSPCTSVYEPLIYRLNTSRSESTATVRGISQFVFNLILYSCQTEIRYFSTFSSSPSMSM